MLLKIMKEKESIRRFALCWRKLQKVQGEKIDNLDSSCTSAIMGTVPCIKGQAHEMNDLLKAL